MKKMLAILVIASLAFSVTSCKSKPKDEDIRKEVMAALSSNAALSGLSAEVKEGVVTVSGGVSDESARSAVDAQLSEIKGVKKVVNNTTVAAPPAPPTNVPEITADDALTTAVRDAIKDHPTVKAEVKEGVIIVTGEIKRADLPTLMEKLQATKPKSIDSKGLVKK
ncbi:MAG: BON domain-containing protein [Terrimonas ferruginea]|uniref:BON domain-containing protein n=1 Tax=Terrimonas ferruginea TaxID=249 RepID=UPI000AFB7A20|nr:BON domain-containing protein [Terrimonas ferruginea]MBN8782900.1 BON domain-containing protein [Terrimonas ferruginea]